MDNSMYLTHVYITIVILVIVLDAINYISIN
jgi:hypothetical protein